MPRPSELRERADQALVRAREIERREEESETPLSQEDQDAHAAAIQEADGLNAQADAIEGRAAASAEAERRVRESERRAATPPRRRSRSPVEEDDGEEPPRSRSRRDGDDGPALEGYSIVRAMRSHTRQLLGKGRFDGLEREWHDHLVHLRGEEAEGVFIPLMAPIPRELVDAPRRRDLTTTTGSGGIPNNLEPTFLDLLRAKLILADLGVKITTGRNKFWLPKKTAGTTGYWVGEGVAVTESDVTVGQVAFDPKTVGGHTVLSRKFLLQSDVGGDDMAVDDIATTIGGTVQRAAFNGSGSSAQPLGVLQNSNVPTVAINTNGGPLTYSKLVELANKPDVSNAAFEDQAFVLHPDSAGRMEATPLVSNFPKYLWDNDRPNPVAGRRAVRTTDLPINLTKGSGTNLAAAIFGAWSQMRIVMFSGLDLIINPFVEDKEGNVRITMHQDVDLNLLYPEAFAKIVDITTAGW